MELSSRAFEHGERIPPRYTCDGPNVSPPLTIAGVPQGARALALVMDDPDAPAGTWDHWVVWNIPPETVEIAEDTEPEGVQGITDFGVPGYGGPCPPSGTHRYQFRLYALDRELDLAEGSTKDQLETVVKEHVLAEARLTGLYRRQR